MSDYEYDLCVIGSGPAGFAAAVRARDFGQRVALIERDKVGGAGVHNGVLSSKTLWELSRAYQTAIRTDRGFVAENVRPVYHSVVTSVERATEHRVRTLRKQLDAFAPRAGSDGGSIDLIFGEASFVSPHILEVKRLDSAGTSKITAEHSIIATGGRPRTLPDIEVDGEYVLSSDHMLSLSDFPKSIVIVGAGVVGCEFATILANFAKTKVYMIDRADRILPFEDADVARICAENLEQKGVTIHHAANLDEMKVVDGKVHYTIRHAEGGLETIEVERALLSIGRIPNTDTLSLDKAGVEQDDYGYIKNEKTITTASHIAAVGDVTRDIALANVAETEAIYAVECLFSEKCQDLSYENISTIMFLDPEVAGIGFNEQQAQERKIPYKVAVYELGVVARAIAMDETEGFVKILVSNDDEMKVLGMRALGEQASNTIEAVSLMIKKQMSAHELADLIHPHPAITEAVQDCMRMLTGRSIYKPEVFPGLRVTSVHYDD